MDKAKRFEIFMQLQTVAAGNRVEDGMAAAGDLLGAMVAFAADTPEHADRLIDLWAEDLKRDVHENWSETREARGRAVAVARTQ